MPDVKEKLTHAQSSEQSKIYLNQKSLAVAARRAAPREADPRNCVGKIF